MAFSDADIVRLWEEGSLQHPLDRAISILLHAHPNLGRNTLAALPIGHRDALLLELREELFGRRIEALTECPTCSEELEIYLDCAEFRGTAPVFGSGQDQTMVLEWGEARIGFRLPDSRDLAVAAATGTVESARAALLQRCVLHAVDQLPAEAVTALVDRMAELDPLGEIILHLDCPCCDERCNQVFDIASFLWNELSVRAKRLLREVHMLARAYGWTEEVVLAMSARRRNLYLEMVAG